MEKMHGSNPFINCYFQMRVLFGGWLLTMLVQIPLQDIYTEITQWNLAPNYRTLVTNLTIKIPDLKFLTPCLLNCPNKWLIPV